LEFWNSRNFRYWRIVCENTKEYLQLF